MTSDADSYQWLDELAAIIELEKCAPNGSPKIIFSRMVDEADVEGTADHDHHAQSFWRKQEAAGWILYDNKAIRIWRHNSRHDVVCEFRDSNSDETKYMDMWDSLQVIYWRSMTNGGLPFHAGLAELDGKGVLFAASGNTGKSTCCRRLPDHWKPLCDDETLVVLDGQRGYRAHPFPTWSYYMQGRARNTWDIQYSVPLSGLFFLEQSETDKIVPLGEGEAAVFISESAIQVCRKFWRGAGPENGQKFSEVIFGNACELAKQIPAFRLYISLHGRFWEKIEEILTSLGKLRP